MQGARTHAIGVMLVVSTAAVALLLASTFVHAVENTCAPASEYRKITQQDLDNITRIDPSALKYYKLGDCGSHLNLNAYTPPGVQAQANPAVCNEVFGLPDGTIMQGVDKSVVANAEACEAYKFLISRYQIGSRSAPCIKTKAQGITGLNPDFAIALAKLLKKAPAHLMVISALRPRACQGSVNSESNHIYGCAVDLGYDQNSCSSSICQWIRANVASEGLQIRMPYAPEWNHIEPADTQKCRSKSPGGGIVPGSTPPSSFPTGVSAPTGGTNKNNPFANPYNPTQLSNLINGQPPPNEFPSSAPTSVPSDGGMPGTPTGTSAPTPSTPSTPNIPVSTSLPKLPSPAINATGTLSALDQLIMISGGSSSTKTGGSTGTSTSSPVKLNDNLNDVIVTPTGGANVSDILSNTLATGSIAINTVYVPETFSGSPSQFATSAGKPSNTSTISQPMLVSVLTAIRDYLVIVLNQLRTKNTAGFKGPWQIPSNKFEEDDE